MLSGGGRHSLLGFRSPGHPCSRTALCQPICGTGTSPRVDVATWATSPDMAAAWVSRSRPAEAVNMGYTLAFGSPSFHPRRREQSMRAEGTEEEGIRAERGSREEW